VVRDNAEGRLCLPRDCGHFGAKFIADHPTCQRRLKIPHFAGRKFPSPGRVVVYSFGCWIQNEFQPVKQRRALVETNLPRNSWPQTHQDDETRGEAEEVLAPGSE
jgi:hypothetical protein